MNYKVETSCRSCGGTRVETVIEFGETPLADRILKEEQLSEPEPKAPLTLARCPDCSLVQIRETVDPEVLYFSEYPYFSSVSPALCRHFEGNAEEVMRRKSLGPDSLVVEAASNDGCLLRNFVAKNIPVMGIDPSEAPVLRARAAGVRTLHEFFTREFAGELAGKGTRADVFLGNNVLAHVADLRGFVAGIATILKEDGLAVLEMPYLLDLIRHCEFDTIYHQHHCYFSLTSLDRLFRDAGLFINDVQHLTIHGGSLRIFAEKEERPTGRIREMMEEEKQEGIASGEILAGFAAKVDALRDALSGKLIELKRQGKSIAAYGAAGKATTLLAYSQITRELVDFVADLNEYKHGKYMGGNHLPIVSPAELRARNPDVVLILAWNFAEEIMNQLEDYRSQGGTFLIPVPDVRLVGDNVR
ncbi:MAG: class I SAM-dependent methyltransferase [Oceanipulchritudo sp.]